MWKILSMKVLSNNVGFRFSDQFTNVVTFHLNVSQIVGQTMGRILSKLTKLKFLKLTGILDPDFFKRFPKGVKCKVTHLEFLSETCLTVFTLEALTEIFPELFFLALSFSHDIILAHLMKDTTKFQKLLFLRLNLLPSHSALKLLSQVAPDLSAIYLHPDCLKCQMKNAQHLFPRT
ncbi:hypothetical protein DSO57_1030209 [Entomophthora muscae]|uniref:Uncharacterized protein n=1 Tax=Entomophthora muscae TaxID=34485 RepID=A0ACC2RRZ2_9FUNG|nr:hypothetical protein DSO57_1030209 [Entomophthora muscae]